jgi:DNA-binding beta-propeller fold protein YncE
LKIAAVSIAFCIVLAPLARAQTGGYPASPSHTITGTNPDGTPRYGSEPAKEAGPSSNTAGQGGANAQSDRGEGADTPTLQLEATIPLGEVRGRIDHMAVDLGRQRLLVAALGHGGLAVVDLKARRLDRIVGGLPEPQGVGYDPVTDTIYVANAGDGSLRLFKGADVSPAGRVDLRSDADNIRVDSKAGRVIVGHGDGALAILDAATHKIIASAALKAHPESFQLDSGSERIFVNLPNAHAIDVIDRTTGRQIASWPTAGRDANFAMALDQPRQHVLVAFRHPPELGVFSAADGKLVVSLQTCGDIDDVFVDSRRDRVYLSCGQGFVDVLAADGATYRPAGRIPTAAGARTSLFVPELDRLLLAVPARGTSGAAIWVYRPSP